jgi:hypothetical protein
MKTANKSAESTKNFDQLISMLSENEILNTESMSNVLGGEGEADGGSNAISRPKF